MLLTLNQERVPWCHNSEVKKCIQRVQTFPRGTKTNVSVASQHTEWLTTISGSLDDFTDELSLASEDEYYDQYCKEIEESDDDSPYYIISYSDYEDTSERDYYNLYDPFGYYEYGDGDLYNSDGEPYDLCYPYSFPWF